MNDAASPLTNITAPWLEDQGVTLLLKRDDLVGGASHGNKRRKLKYVLKDAIEKGYSTVLTFGGAFSNHLFAVAASGAQLGLKTIGVVRGEIDHNNPTIRVLRLWNMMLIPESRSNYRLKGTQAYIDKLRQRFPEVYLIPEGGHTDLALLGVHELVEEVRCQCQTSNSLWCTAMATGSTAIGIGQKLLGSEGMHVFCALKGVEHVAARDTIIEGSNLLPHQLSLHDAYLKGFARRDSRMETFIKDFYRDQGILLDPLYTGKMFYRLKAMIGAGSFTGRTIIAIHTGGLQGNAGYNYRYGTNLPTSNSSP